MTIGEKIRLYPTKEQEDKFRQFCGTARFVYNECLAYKINMYSEYGYSCTIQDLIEHIRDMKYTDKYAWICETPEAVSKQAIKDLDNAYKMFFKKGNEGFPRFKLKGKCRESFYQRTDGFRMIDATHIKLTGIGSVRIREHWWIDKVLNPRVTFDGKFWYLSFSLEVEEDDKSDSEETLGVDLGISVLAYISDGRVYENINKDESVKRLIKRKKHLQRLLSKKYLLHTHGMCVAKTNNIRKLEKQIRIIDRKLRNIRETYIHNVTKDLVRTKPKAIVIEDLNVSGLMRNRYVARSIQEQCWYKFRQYLLYKCQYYNIDVVIADRFYPSSKMCNCCGNKKKYLPLNVRTYSCFECGYTEDRDFNAALNLRDYGINYFKSA